MKALTYLHAAWLFFRLWRKARRDIRRDVNLKHLGWIGRERAAAVYLVTYLRTAIRCAREVVEGLKLRDDDRNHRDADTAATRAVYDLAHPRYTSRGSGS